MLGITKLVDWLWLAFQTVVILVRNAIVAIFNEIIESIASAAEMAVALLPTYTIPTPGQLVDSVGFLSILNWVLPIGFFIDCMVMVIFGVLTFNALAPIMRWTKIFR